MFPENVVTARTAPRALQLKQLLAVIYIFGGIGGLLKILSKFVVSPLFEQLTYERRLMAQDAREKQVKLNILLSRMVTEVPSFELKADPHYREAIIPARSTFSPLTKSELEGKKEAEKYEGKLHELSLLINESDPNNEIFGTNSQIVSQSEEILKYIRQLQYESSPSAFTLPGLQEDKRTPFLKAVFEFKQEIRAVKSAILSSGEIARRGTVKAQ